MKLFAKKNNYLLFAFLFFVIFSPHISIFNLTIKTVYLFVVIPAMLGLIYSLQQNHLPKYIKITVLLMIFSLVYNVLIYLLHGFVDLSWIIQILMGFIEIFAAIFVGNIYVNIYKNEALNKIIVHLFYVGIIHSILMLIIFLSPSFRDLFYSFVKLTELAYNATFRTDNQTRFSGFLNSGFGSLSVLNALMFLMGLYSYMFIKKISFTNFISGSILLLISSILSGRIGIVIMLIVLSIFLLVPTLKLSIFKRKLKILLIIVPLILIFVILLNFYFPDKAQFAFETYFKYLDTGKLDNSSESILSENLNPNLSYLEKLFGTGNYTIDYADSGYIIMINGGGIIGTIVSYSFLLSTSSLKQLNFKNKYRYILILLTLIIVFINYKNLYFFGYNDVFQIYFLITCTAAILEYKKSKYEII